VNIKLESDDNNGETKGDSQIKSEVESKKDANNLFCTYCQKKFAKETVMKAHINSKKHLKMVSAAQQSELSHPLQKEIFALEVKISRVAELLADQLDATKENIEKKQSRSIDELITELEIEEEIPVVESDDEEEVQPVQGIQNYPLDWDGKPIPYWLYKLHGLRVEYKCEICGNTSYWGRRAFERHFQEWRHAYGMRCLKIPNTRHFQEVTKINDAIELYKKIKSDQYKVAWKPDVEEEYEDGEGNVFSKKTYLDLQRQGLI